MTYDALGNIWAGLGALSMLMMFIGYIIGFIDSEIYTSKILEVAGKFIFVSGLVIFICNIIFLLGSVAWISLSRVGS